MSALRGRWKRYNFFDAEDLIQDVKSINGSDVTCGNVIESCLFLGHENGQISVSDDKGKLITVKDAFTEPPSPVLCIATTLCKVQLYKTNRSNAFGGAYGMSSRDDTLTEEHRIVACADQNWVKFWRLIPSFEEIFKIDLQDTSKSAGASGDPTTMIFNKAGSQLVIGFSTGAILILEGNFPNARLNPSSTILLRKPNIGPSIVSMFFATANSVDAKYMNSEKLQYLQSFLFVVTDKAPIKRSDHSQSGVLVYDTSRGSVEVLHDEGTSLPSTVTMDLSQDRLVVGREQALYFYTKDVRESAKAFPDLLLSSSSQGVTYLGRSQYLIASTQKASERTLLQIYDSKLRLIASEKNLPNEHKVRYILTDDSTIQNDVISSGTTYIITTLGLCKKLKEQSVKTKVDSLVDPSRDKKSFGVAIRLAYSCDYEASKIAEVYKLYANDLYSKRDYQGAIIQYCNTIGFVAPSYVISRYLDAQKLSQLTTYLEAIHIRGLSTPELTTFLLNCYTKLKNMDKIEQFISSNLNFTSFNPNDKNSLIRTRRDSEQGQRHSEEDVPNAPFWKDQASNNNYLESIDINTAIEVLQGSKDDENAVTLAKQKNRYDLYLKVQLEREIPKVDEALSYIQKLPEEEGYKQLLKYGTQLVDGNEDLITEYILHLCANKFVSDAKIEDFIHLFAKKPHYLRGLLQKAITTKNDSNEFIPFSTSMADTLLGLLLFDWYTAVEEKGFDSTEAIIEEEEIDRFLTCERFETKEFIRNARLHDRHHHAMTLFEMYDYKKGTSFFHEKNDKIIKDDRSTELLLDHYIQESYFDALIKKIEILKHKKMPNIWSKVLKYLLNEASLNVARANGDDKNVDINAKRSNYRGDISKKKQLNNSSVSSSSADGTNESDDSSSDESDDDDDEDDSTFYVWNNVRKLLVNIRQQQHLTPMAIIDVCEQNEDLPLDIVKKTFLEEYFTASYNELIDKQRKIDEIEANRREMKNRLNTFKTQAVTFNNQKCHGCQRTLDLPTIHFLCMHSYHYDETCMQNVEDACYECQPEAQ